MNLRHCLVILVLTALMGCDSVGYYSQAAVGQLDIYRSRRSIPAVIDDPQSDAKLVERLQLINSLREFAQSRLQLPVDGQFGDYVDLGRDYVVWNVFVAQELSLEAQTWCYPIAGCAAYRGYFHEGDAIEFAQRYSQQGYDTYVAGISAYSTLGWFDDPVLNTFIYRDEVQLADLIFHELAHQQLYIAGDTLFNESFATAVAKEGVKRWMQQRGSTGQYAHYLQSIERQHEFIGLLKNYTAQLDQVYTATDSGADEKRAQKQQLIDSLRQDFLGLQQKWSDAGVYSGWMAGPLNNAKLNSVALYHDLVPAIERLLAEEDHDLGALYARLAKLESLTPEERQRVLAVD